MEMHDFSIFRLLSNVFPNYEWLPWKFIKSTHNYWENIENQRKFMEWAGKQLGYKEMDDWYKMTGKVNVFICCYLLLQDICDLGGTSLYILYNNSPTHLLTSVFPEHNWQPWKFSKISKFWAIDAALFKFMEHIQKQQKMKDLSSWYKISAKVYSSFI